MSKSFENGVKREKTPFRSDIVGSFLRPGALKIARAKFKNNEISEEELRKIEDEEIIKLVKKEKAVGLKGVTDGEFRRSWWHFDFYWGLEGLAKQILEEGKQFNGMKTRAETVQIVGKLGGKNHPFVEHFKFLKNIAGDEVVPRQSVPAPAQLIRKFLGDDGAFPENLYYSNIDEFIVDLAKAYGEFISELYEAGCRSLQFDDCSWGSLVDKDYVAKCQSNGYKFDELAETFLRANNLALEYVPDDMFVSTHVCRGNYRSTFHSSGSYDPVEKYLLARENVDAFYLEFDSERAGGFEPLQYVPEGKKVVLGLVTTKNPGLEDKEYIKSRILEASKYVDLDNLFLSPQCGFSSTEEGNNLTEEQQWNKLHLIKEIADGIWK